MSTSSSARGPMSSCSPRWPTSSSTRASRDQVVRSHTSTVSARWPTWCGRSRPKRPKRAPGCRSRRSGAWRVNSRRRDGVRSTPGSACARPSSAPPPTGWSTCSTSSPGDSTRWADGCSRSRRSTSRASVPSPPTCPAMTAGDRACAGSPRSPPSSRRARSPTRSSRRARARSVPWCSSLAIPCSPCRRAVGSTRHSRHSTSAWPSTTTSTSPRVTPTSSCLPRQRWSARSSISSSPR